MWEIVKRPGYFGKHRDEKFKAWDEQYGKGNWRIVWATGNSLGEGFVDFHGACALYEDAYFKFISENSSVFRQLIDDASEVYDVESSDVDSGLDYMKQQLNRTHIQDIAIRRCLVRMGVWFRGKELIRIRQELGKHPLSITLSPGRVPFHRLGSIFQPELTGWWHPQTVEAFYQSNKFLQAKHSVKQNLD